MFIPIGGCTVGPYNEIAGGGSSGDVASRRKHLFDLGASLQSSYVAETTLARHGGEALLSAIEHQQLHDSRTTGHDIQELTSRAAHIAATVQSQEHESRALELQLTDAHYMQEADRVFNALHRAKHTQGSLDVSFLDVVHLTWKPQVLDPRCVHPGGGC